MFKYYIQAKINGRFKALNLSEGVTIDRLIYASFFDSKEKANKALETLSRHNPSIEFKVIKA